MREPFLQQNDPPNQLSNAGAIAELPVDQYLKKIIDYPASRSEQVIPIDNPLILSEDERTKLLEHIALRNFVVYHYDECEPAFYHGYQRICQQLGLSHSVTNPAAGEDDVTTIEVVQDQSKHTARYIPFTNQALKWHTDGYYNDADNAIRAFVLHCRQPAENGGETSLIDHELVLALLYQQNPEWIKTLADTNTMTIPANIQNGMMLRKAYTGPVFARDTLTGQLAMRYTERRRNITWKSDHVTQEALEAIKEILDNQSQWITQLTLQAGQGIIANNVLHNRSAFKDSTGSASKVRKLERIRFSDRVDTV